MTRAPHRATLLLVLLLAGCQLGGETTAFAPAASCTPVTGACSADADCCSYGCVSGVCAANPLPGGLCRTSDDCGVAVSATGFQDMACVGARCTTDYLCRQADDVCASDGDCCTGNCVGGTYAITGTCRPNQAPAVSLGADRTIPWHQPATVTAAVADPDGDTLVYGWTLVSQPPGGTAVLSSTTGSSQPSFTPNVQGPYVVRLTVTDGLTGQRERLTTSDEVIFTAINTPPVVAALAGQPHASRNVSQPLSAGISDLDGDALTCTWWVTPPGGEAAAVAGPAPCAGSFAGAFTPNVEGAWTVRLDATDGVNTTAGSATYDCVNDAPVAVAGLDRAWNLGDPAAATPALRLTGSSDDLNGDPAATTTWTVVAPLPAGTAYTDGEVVSSAPVADFVPDVVGTFTLRYAVTDRPGSEGADALAVDVARHVRALAHDVRDADHAHGAGKLVLVGADPAVATSGLVSVVDLATGAETSFAVGTAPLNQVDVAEDGTFAMVADGTWIRRFTLGASPAQAWAISQPSVDLAVAGANAYAFPTVSAQIVRISGTGALTDTGFWASNGVGHPAGTHLYVSEAYDIERYAVTGSGGGQGSLSPTGSISPAYCTGRRTWLTQNAQHVVDSCGSVFDVSGAGITSVATEASPSGIVHLDSSAAGQVVAVTGGTSVHRLNASFVASAADALPHWASPAGERVPAYAEFVFLAADGTRWVIVTATHGGAKKTGLVRFGP
jgi:hypothetical protein